MAILLEKPKRSSGGHWYTREGKAKHTMPRASGEGERNTTLRDAKKHGLFPSVTTLLGLFAKPGLERWKQDQLLHIAFDNPAKLDESFENYADRCLVQHEKPVEEAADFGTKVHDAIEAYFEGQHIPDELLGYIQPALDWKQENQLTFTLREKLLVNLQHGFAGTVDIVGRGSEGQQFILDWKTRKTKEGHRVHGANCFISSTQMGRFEVIRYSPEDLAKAWVDFTALCQLWRSLKNYDPRNHGK